MLMLLSAFSPGNYPNACNRNCSKVQILLPLAVILLAANNRFVAKNWASWERAAPSRQFRLWHSVAMVALGLIMLVWVIR